MEAMAADEYKTYECNKHGEYKAVNPSRAYAWGIAYKPMCPVCKNELLQQEKVQIEREKEQENIRKWQSMNIEARFLDASFDNFKAYNPELQKHLNTCQSFAENPAGKLVMIGENGNGKTHLAISILKKVGGKIYTAYEIGIRIRKSYDGEIKEWVVFDELCTVPLLVIDEVEKIKDSEAKHNWFSHVVGKRYDKRLPTIFIANGHTKGDCKEVNKPCLKCLEHHLENDVLSRIIEDGEIMKFCSKDYRMAIRNARQ